MATQPKVIDPDLVIEALCDGPFALSWSGRLGTIAFSHNRPRPEPLFEGTMETDSVVRARVTMTVENWAAMRDYLNKIFADIEAGSAPSGASPKMH